MEDWLKETDEAFTALGESKHILFIGDVSSFIGNAIGENLKENGFTVAFAKPEVGSITREKEGADIFLFYLTEDMEKLSEALVYIKDTCVEEEKSLFFVGYESEIQEAEEIFPESLVTGTFERPINVKEMVEKLKELVENEEHLPKKKHILVVDDSGTFLRTIKSHCLGGQHTPYILSRLLLRL